MKSWQDRLHLIEDGKRSSKHFLVDIPTGEVIYTYHKVKRKDYGAEYHTTVNSIRDIRGKDDMYPILGNCEGEMLYAPKALNTLISNKQHDKLMALCSAIMGYNYTYLTAQELISLWGCKTR